MSGASGGAAQVLDHYGTTSLLPRVAAALADADFDHRLTRSDHWRASISSTRRAAGDDRVR